MILRKATKADTDELMAFYARMNEVINRRTNNYNPDNEIFPSCKMVSTAIESGGQYVGIEDKKIIAAAIVNHECDEKYFTAPWNTKADASEFWVLHALRIAPEYEGRGYAKQIIKYLIEIAPEHGQKAIRLDVMEEYPIEKLYENLGFKYIDTIEINYADIGFPVKFRLFEKSLI